MQCLPFVYDAYKRQTSNTPHGVEAQRTLNVLKIYVVILEWIFLQVYLLKNQHITRNGVSKFK